METSPAKIRTLIFLEDAKGTLRKFSEARYSRMFSQDENESLPEYAGSWLRFAQITVGMRPRQPPVVLQVHYIRHKVAKDGRFEPAGLLGHLHLGASQAEPMFRSVLDPDSLPDVATQMRQNELARELLWEPTTAQDQAVRQAALGAVALSWKRALEPTRAARLRKRLKFGRRDRMAQNQAPLPPFPASNVGGKISRRDPVWRVFHFSADDQPRKFSKEEFRALISDERPVIWPRGGARSRERFAVCQFGAASPAARVHYIELRIDATGKPSRVDRDALSQILFELDFPAISGKVQAPPSLRWKPAAAKKRRIEFLLAGMNPVSPSPK
jgi:hypothetical protein